ncbi:MAG TPA: hypothetical protein VIF57_14340 [Polyangia bacterium]|jgi:hypothetical protein
MTSVATGLGRHRRALLFAGLLIAIELSYVAIVTAGRFTTWPTWNANYDLLAEGFRSGHLYLAEAPRPELLAKANPFDPRWRPLWFWDASLHGDHYYLYWGPLPALALAAVKTVFRMRATVGDQFPLFAFYTLALGAGALLIARMRRRLFPHAPSWLVALGIAVFAYANPTPYLIATPGIYEAAIAGGQAFLLLGLLLAFEALWREGQAGRRPLLIAAGVAWGCAFACRASAILPAAILVPLTALAVAPPAPGTPRSWRAALRPALWLAAPMAAFVAAHLAYNRLRFGAWLEFGLSKQLSTMQFRAAPAYLLPNLYSYLLRPLHHSCQFPFVSAPAGLGPRAIPYWLPFPRGYAAPEPVAGLLKATPWVLLAGLATVLVVALLRRARRAPAELLGAGDDARRARATLWCGVALLVIGTVTGLPEITEFFASMRFLADVAAGLVLAGAWAACALFDRIGDRPWPGRILTAVVVALGGASIVLGLLLGVQGYDGMFERHNPELFQRWVSLLSRC